jgi:hypothetical protein
LLKVFTKKYTALSAGTEAVGLKYKKVKKTAYGNQYGTAAIICQGLIVSVEKLRPKQFT